MKRRFLSITAVLGLIFYLFIGWTNVSFAVPAFPGAEGFGANTIGGRGGKVLLVTNLNDSGSGSLREAVKSSGPRIVVFRVGGLITLQSDVWINTPYLTVAGQTAPGDGICIRGGALRIETHDVIIRGLRIRPGDLVEDSRKENGDGITVENPDVEPYNVIIDHCSISWATDENMATYWPCRNITLQWCIISEALHWEKEEGTGDWDSGYAILIGPNAKKISVHHNLIAHHQDRSPLIYTDSETEVINNVIYNWTWYATHSVGKANIIGNQYVKGPNWRGGKGIAFPEEAANSKGYLKSNIGPNRETDTGDEWLIGTVALESQKSTTLVTESSGIATTAINDVLTQILESAGARWPKRDPVDERVITSVKNTTGTLITSQKDVGGWPTYASGTAPTDTDSDGMPDSWETAHGLNTTDAADAVLDRNGDGYQNIEEYINGLISSPDATLPKPPENLRITS